MPRRPTERIAADVCDEEEARIEALERGEEYLSPPRATSGAAPRNGPLPDDVTAEELAAMEKQPGEPRKTS